MFSLPVKKKVLYYTFPPVYRYIQRFISKGSIIETVAKAEGIENVDFEVLKRSKDEAANKALFDTVLGYMENVCLNILYMSPNQLNFFSPICRI